MAISTNSFSSQIRKHYLRQAKARGHVAGTGRKRLYRLSASYRNPFTKVTISKRMNIVIERDVFTPLYTITMSTETSRLYITCQNCRRWQKTVSVSPTYVCPAPHLSKITGQHS
ncbi:hypothetical protein [Desulforhopalus sp. 52FAK]